MLDASGAVKSSFDYYPFGKDAGSQVNNDARFRFTGKELDDEGNLDWYYFGARYYDPEVGRWFVTDPVKQTFSPYAFVGNNPMINVDPNGMFFGDIMDGIGWGLKQIGDFLYYVDTNLPKWTGGRGVNVSNENPGQITDNTGISGWAYDPCCGDEDIDDDGNDYIGLSGDRRHYGPLGIASDLVNRLQGYFGDIYNNVIGAPEFGGQIVKEDLQDLQRTADAVPRYGIGLTVATVRGADELSSFANYVALGSAAIGQPEIAGPAFVVGRGARVVSLVGKGILSIVDFETYGKDAGMQLATVIVDVTVAGTALGNTGYNAGAQRYINNQTNRFVGTAYGYRTQFMSALANFVGF